MKMCPRCGQLTFDLRPLRGEYRCTRNRCGHAEKARPEPTFAPMPKYPTYWERLRWYGEQLRAEAARIEELAQTLEQANRDGGLHVLLPSLRDYSVRTHLLWLLTDRGFGPVAEAIQAAAARREGAEAAINKLRGLGDAG